MHLTTGLIFMITGKFKIIILCLSLWLINLAYAAVPFNLINLSQQFHQPAKTKLAFVQQRYFKFSSKPVVTSGYLYFRAPDYFMQETLQPVPQRLIATGEKLIIEKKGKIFSTATLKQAPNAAILIYTLKQLLNGKIQGLSNYFSVSLSGNAAQWMLRLKPKPGYFATVKMIQVQGKQNRIFSVVVYYRHDEVLVLKLR